MPNGLQIQVSQFDYDKLAKTDKISRLLLNISNCFLIYDGFHPSDVVCAWDWRVRFNFEDKNTSNYINDLRG